VQAVGRKFLNVRFFYTALYLYIRYDRESTEIVYIFIIHYCLLLPNILQRLSCSSLAEFIKRKNFLVCIF